MPNSSAQDCNPRGSQFHYLPDLLAIDSCRPFGRILVSCISPLDVVAWRRELASHANQFFANCILDDLKDFQDRLRLRPCYEKCRSAKPNMQSAAANSLVVDSYLRAEVAVSSLFGPVDLGVSTVQVSPIGLVLKNHQPWRWRFIVQLFSPRLANVNEGIATNLCSLPYARVDEAAQCLWQLDPGALIAKFEIESAYRQIPVHPDDRHLLSVVQLDRALPCCHRWAPKILSAVADALSIMHVLHKDQFRYSQPGRFPF